MTKVWPFSDPVADLGLEDEAAAVADHVVLVPAAGPRLDGGQADDERVDGLDEAGGRRPEFRLFGERPAAGNNRRRPAARPPGRR